MINETAGAHQEAIETVFGVQLLNLVEQTGNNVVATRSLTSTEDHTNVHSLGGLALSGNKLYQRHTVGIGEELFDFFLIVNALFT